VPWKKLNLVFNINASLSSAELIAAYSRFFPKFDLNLKRVIVKQKEILTEERVNNNQNELIFEVRMTPYLYENQLTGVVIFFNDITPTKNIETKLSRLTSVLRNFNRAILIVDFQGNIIAWDSGAELMYGYSESEALLLNIKQMTPLEKSADTQQLLDEIRYGAGFESVETQRITKEGKIRYIMTTGTPLFNEKGERYGARVTEYDITEQKLLLWLSRKVKKKTADH
jgi:PAS domain S-box-containing protein